MALKFLICSFWFCQMISPSFYFSALWSQMLITLYRVIPLPLFTRSCLTYVPPGSSRGWVVFSYGTEQLVPPDLSPSIMGPAQAPAQLHRNPATPLSAAEWNSCFSQTLPWTVTSFITNRSLCTDPCLSGTWVWDCPLCIILCNEHDFLVLQINRKEIRH